MVTYIYFVKCPNCEDEHFDFFDDAKTYAMGCISEKPIITQTEVNRNDFGECTDHCDLGTIWSWEDAVGKVTDAEPTVSVFTKDDLCNYIDDDSDPEFDSLDNSVDYEIEEISDETRKPIPEGMTIEELVEAMEENEDTVECTKCGGLFEKAGCTHNKEGFGWCCESCGAVDSLEEDRDLGNNFDGGYPEYELATLVKDSINHLTNDLGKDPWADDFADSVAADLEANYDIEVPEDMETYSAWFSAVACEVSRQVNNPDNLTEELTDQDLNYVRRFTKDTSDLVDERTTKILKNQEVLANRLTNAFKALGQDMDTLVTKVDALKK